MHFPFQKNSKNYWRLNRIFTDRTRFHGKIDSEKRYHEFYNIQHETNLTVTLWENFSIINPNIWIKNMLNFLNINFDIGKITKCNWSYEWEKRLEKGIKLCDIVIQFESENNEKYLIVVESKNLKKPLSDKDTQPEYYLEIDDFNDIQNKIIIYCVDESMETIVKNQIKPTKTTYAVLTWPNLAKIQFESIKKENYSENLKGFLCGTILNQFNSKNIFPELPFDYLKEEITETDFENNKFLREQKFGMNKKTTANMGFMQCGGEGIIESVCILATKNHFLFDFLVYLQKEKWFLFSSGKVGSSVIFCPALHKAPNRYATFYENSANNRIKVINLSFSKQRK